MREGESPPSIHSGPAGRMSRQGGCSTGSASSHPWVMHDNAWLRLIPRRLNDGSRGEMNQACVSTARQRLVSATSRIEPIQRDAQSPAEIMKGLYKIDLVDLMLSIHAERLYTRPRACCVIRPFVNGINSWQPVVLNAPSHPSARFCLDPALASR